MKSNIVVVVVVAAVVVVVAVIVWVESLSHWNPSHYRRDVLKLGAG